MDLNNSQRSAVFSEWPQVLCVAGPGSGKTRTLVERIIWLAKQRNGPQGVLVVTFTNAAAAELQQRVSALAGPECALGYCGTLHGFLLRLLRANHKLAGLPKEISVVDDDAKEGLVEQVKEEMLSEGQRKKATWKKVEPLLGLASLIDAVPSVSRSVEELVAVEYHRRLRQSGLLDFDAILHYGEKLVEKLRANLIHPLGEWPFDHLLVDEAQDSADTDWRIYEAMPCKTKFLVGDPDQSVYKFRGANVGNMVEATRSGDWKVLHLEENYRCRHNVAAAAQKLVEHNSARVDKHTVAAHPGGHVESQGFATPVLELSFVAAYIAQDTASAAVLARTNRLANEAADFLKAKGIKVAARVENNGYPFDWKAAKLLLTVLGNPYNDMAVYQYLVVKHGKAAADVAKREAAVEMVPLASKAKCDFSGMAVSLTAEGISAESRERIHDACRQLSTRGQWSLADLLLYLHSGERKREEGEGVVVTTLHGAKGREWATVVVIGCEEGTLPQSRKDSDVEEERRLMFVGMTRARERLLLTCCKSRPAPFGTVVMRPCEPSRFILEAGL